jgi:hypothetical protein
MGKKVAKVSKTYTGTLHDWFETGCEGLVWILMQDGMTGYEAMVIPESRDHLKVYAEDGSVLFDGVIIKDTKTGRQPYPYNPKLKQQVALGMWIHWVQKGWKPDDWARLFVRKEGEKPLRAELTRMEKKS